MMASTSDFALLALRTCSTPSAIAINGNKEKNCPAVPVGWIKREWYPDEGIGFSYDIYQNGQKL